MDVRAAAALIRAAIPRGTETWADLGAGSGTFTIALTSLLGPGSRVIAVDHDAAALKSLREAAERAALGKQITVLQQDFRGPLNLPPLDGVLLANALHFVPTQEQFDFLARVTRYVRRGGRLLIVDYEGRGANQWVPYPIATPQLAQIVANLGYEPLSTVGTRPSQYGGISTLRLQPRNRRDLTATSVEGSEPGIVLAYY
ncbi:MAG: class I SAM-dependent methyltransferase [Gemmatimonadaceae bacterium]